MGSSPGESISSFVNYYLFLPNLVITKLDAISNNLVLDCGWFRDSVGDLPHRISTSFGFLPTRWMCGNDSLLSSCNK